ncbi:MAG: DUF222 domain-containing protein, partial [Actinobacteria bacterium]|nr:DUF222 domain-containing protein [Actinomycetota bacterium]
AERRVSALRTVLVGEAEEAGSAMRVRRTPLRDWLAGSGQQSPRQGAAAVWKARELELRPRVQEAATTGRISLDQASAINQALNGLPADLDRDQRRLAETLILDAAAHTPAERLRSMSEKLVAQVAPSHTETPGQRGARLEARDARARARRCLRFGAEADGSVDFSGSLPVLDGRQLQQVVQAIADRDYRSAKDTHDRRRLLETPQQRLADALSTLVVAAQSVENTGSSPADGAGPGLPAAALQVMVVVPYEGLLDRACDRGVLMDGTPVSPGELRMRACDADLVPVVLGTGSTVLDVGRRHRLAPPGLRLAVALRDGGCAFPGCTTPMWHCDVHHVVPWQLGGATSLGNLVALCRSHHGLIEPSPLSALDDGRSEAVDQWQVRIDSRGLPEFLPPCAVDPARVPIRKVASHAQLLLDTG